MANVQTTASGLQYEVITEGAGKKPQATDTVVVHYRGTFPDGKEFDSSYKRMEPISFPLNGVIAGSDKIKRPSGLNTRHASVRACSGRPTW